MKKDQSLGFVSVALFILGLIVVMASEPAFMTIVFGMILIGVSLITATYMINFPSKQPKTRKKRPIKRKKKKK